MEAGDPALFYHEGTFSAVGRAGAAFESPEAGAELRGTNESRSLFTVPDYTEVSVSPGRVADLLGYDGDWMPITPTTFAKEITSIGSSVRSGTSLACAECHCHRQPCHVSHSGHGGTPQRQRRVQPRSN